MRIIPAITTGPGTRGAKLPTELFDGQARELDANDAASWGYASLRGVRSAFRRQAKGMDSAQGVKTRLMGEGDSMVLQVQAVPAAAPVTDAPCEEARPPRRRAR